MKTNIIVTSLCFFTTIIIIIVKSLHELFIPQKRASRIQTIKADIKWLAGKSFCILRTIGLYILNFLKWLLHIFINFLRFIGRTLELVFKKLKKKYQEYTDKFYQVPQEFLLTLEENLEMVKKLGEKLYDVPVLENVYLDHYVAVSYQISAAGTAYRYESADAEVFKKAAANTIRNFISEKRSLKAYIHIIAATPTYLHFAVTYTEYGRVRLLQIYPPFDGSVQQAPLPPLEERIPEEEAGKTDTGMLKLGYYKEDYLQTGLKVPLHIVLPEKNSNILLAGKSGSGKSLSALFYLYNMFDFAGTGCYIADYKGGREYEAFEGSPSYASGEDTIKMVNGFYEFFTAVRSRRLKLRKHYTLFIEEWFGLLTYAETKSKSLKAELMAKVGEMLAVSRGLNMGLLICVQRADAALFSSGSRDNFQVVCCFGKCSAEQFRMLGFSNEMEENPTGAYRPGEALVLIDGQESVHEIIVPFITDSGALCRKIRAYLDRQPDICSLTRAVAEGGGTGQ